MTPHKHAELIKAWADGAEIEWNSPRDKEWLPKNHSEWFIHFDYRIKPEPKLDIEKYYQVFKFVIYSDETIRPTTNLKLTFDGETGKLKSAEVL